MMHHGEALAVQLSAHELETLLETTRDATGGHYSSTPDGARDALMALLRHCGAATSDAVAAPAGTVPLDDISDPVRIATDGSCLGNPGPGGWAFVVNQGDGRAGPEVSGGAKNTTNNRMELQAVIEALTRVGPKCHVEVTTDSTYVKNGCESWMRKWKESGWKTAGGQPVKNKDLWVRLDGLLDDRRVKFRWTRGRAGDPQNERADTLAREAAEMVTR